MPITNEEKAWLMLDEGDFHRSLHSHLVHKGSLGDIFPTMVQYNTSHYVLKQLAPEELALRLKQDHRVSFAVAEKGWKGRLSNLQSRFTKTERGYRLRADKSYAFNAELYCIVAPFDTKVGIGMVESADVQLRSRKEPATQFYNSRGELVMDHFFLKADCELSQDKVLLLRKADYMRIATQIPLREITSLSLMIDALSKFYGLAGMPRESWEAILKNREAGRLRAQSAKIAAQELSRMLPALLQEEIPEKEFLLYFSKMFERLLG